MRLKPGFVHAFVPFHHFRSKVSSAAHGINPLKGSSTEPGFCGCLYICLWHLTGACNAYLRYQGLSALTELLRGCALPLIYKGSFTIPTPPLQHRRPSSCICDLVRSALHHVGARVSGTLQISAETAANTCTSSPAGMPRIHEG